MISMEQINGEIAALENEKPTYVTMQKLSTLYIVRDHMLIGNKPTVTNAETIPTGTSEFMKLVSGKNQSSVFNVMDELMNTLSILNPALYNGVMRKLNNIS